MHGAPRAGCLLLGRQAGLKHGAVGEWPAWFVAPCVSVWAVESLKHPGSVGWWVICGDLPTDYCGSGDCDHPRLAIAQIAARWSSALEETKLGATEIGSIGLPVSSAALLRARIDLLTMVVEDDQYWGDDT